MGDAEDRDEPVVGAGDGDLRDQGFDEALDLVVVPLVMISAM
ncbi:hypothetical protein [Actinokineospora enzanensis]|nr:hypothetical protein [Actinokineospora enzanensis]